LFLALLLLWVKFVVLVVWLVHLIEQLMLTSDLVAQASVERHKLVVLIRLVLDQFILVIVVQEQEYLDVAQKTQLHRFLDKPLFAFAVGYLHLLINAHLPV